VIPGNEGLARARRSRARASRDLRGPYHRRIDQVIGPPATRQTFRPCWWALHSFTPVYAGVRAGPLAHRPRSITATPRAAAAVC